MPKRSDILPKTSGKSPKGKQMSTQSEARALLWAAVPPEIGDNRKSWFRRASHALGWNPRRVRAIWHCEARVITADEWKTLNQRLDALKAAERRHQEQFHELQQAYRAAREDRVVVGGSAVALGDAPPRGRDA